MKKVIEMTYAVLVDLSGTLYVENSVIPGAVEALDKLRNFPNLKIAFVTNTTKESDRCIRERMKMLGFSVHGKEPVFTSLIAARNLVKERKLKPMLLLEDVAMEDFQDIACDSNSEPNAVVIGLAPSKFDYHTMNKAFNLVLNGAALIGIHKARYYKTEKSLCLGPGPFVTAIEYATDKKADVVGKPEKSFFNEALKRCVGEEPINREHSFMIGDDVRDDIGGAQSVGIKGILVKTGKYRSNNESKISPGPWQVANDFAEAVDLIISHLTSIK